MQAQDFESVSGLLPLVESAVLEAHRKLFEREGRTWSRPVAYHWLRYEDPDPIERLKEGVERLRSSGERLDQEAVEKACREAEKVGFSI
jgi:hypothetical protein